MTYSTRIEVCTPLVNRSQYGAIMEPIRNPSNKIYTRDVPICADAPFSAGLHRMVRTKRCSPQAHRADCSDCAYLYGYFVGCMYVPPQEVSTERVCTGVQGLHGSVTQGERK